MPVYPFLFLAMALCMVMPQAPRTARIAVFFLMIVNLVSASAIRVHDEEDKAVQRLKPLLPLPPHSLIFVVGDNTVARFRLNVPFHEINESDFETAGVFTPMINTAFWKRDFANRVLAEWKRGGGIWVTTRVWAQRPRREWNWVEGDDPDVKWKDIVEFFKLLEHDDGAPREDGFALLPRSARNHDILGSFANSTKN